MFNDGPERVRGDVQRHVGPGAAVKRCRFREIELGLEASAFCWIDISPSELDLGTRHAKCDRDHRAYGGGGEQQHDAQSDHSLRSTSRSRNQGILRGRNGHTNTGTSTIGARWTSAMIEMTAANGRIIEWNMRNVPSEGNSHYPGFPTLRIRDGAPNR
jgi:hypothetical protein